MSQKLLKFLRMWLLKVSPAASENIVNCSSGSIYLLFGHYNLSALNDWGNRVLKLTSTIVQFFMLDYK
jgi:hypothetical protein